MVALSPMVAKTAAGFESPLILVDWHPGHPPCLDPYAPVGLYDSGIGGLTVLKTLSRRLPHERFVYIADQAHVPYGGRPLNEIRRFAGAQARWLFDRGVKMVVMACNISSATALETVEADIGPSHVVGVVRPGAAAAARVTQTGHVGVLATAGTVASGAYVTALAQVSPELTVHQIACPRFVPLVEADQTHSEAAHEAAKDALEPLTHAGVDTVILGCTHYPFLLDALRTVAPNVKFIDPADETAVLVHARLKQTRLIAPSARGPHRLCTTGPLAPFRGQLARLGLNPDAASQLRWMSP